MTIELRYLDLEGVEQHQVLDGPEIDERWFELKDFLAAAIHRGCWVDRKPSGQRDYIPASRLLGIRVHGLDSSEAE